MNVVELPKATVSDIPRVLRSIADEIEAGAYGKVTDAVVVVNGEQGVATFGAGLAEYYRAIALFQLGIAKMTKDIATFEG